MSASLTPIFGKHISSIQSFTVDIWPVSQVRKILLIVNLSWTFCAAYSLYTVYFVVDNFDASVLSLLLKSRKFWLWPVLKICLIGQKIDDWFWKGLSDFKIWVMLPMGRKMISACLCPLTVMYWCHLKKLGFFFRMNALAYKLPLRTMHLKRCPSRWL